MYCNKQLAALLVLISLHLPKANASTLNELYESIGYYSSAHDVLNWLSETDECSYIFVNNRIPSTETVQNEILAALPSNQSQGWLDYYDREKTKKKYIETRLIAASLFEKLRRSGMDSRTACGILSAKTIDEYGKARQRFIKASNP